MILKIFTAWLIIVMVFFFIAWFVKRLTKKEALGIVKHTLVCIMFAVASVGTLIFVVINF